MGKDGGYREIVSQSSRGDYSGLYVPWGPVTVNYPWPSDAWDTYIKDEEINKKQNKTKTKQNKNKHTGKQKQAKK